MNPNNYCSLSAAQRLHEAGIVIETDWYYCRVENGWYFRDEDNYHREVFLSIPAPSTAEILWELPSDPGELIHALMRYWSCDHYPNLLARFIAMLRDPDALIDFLIWVRKERANGKS